MPRCVMDMAMGSDHLQQKQFVSKRKGGGGGREPWDEAQLSAAQSSQESGLREKGESGECEEAAWGWQTEWGGHLLRKL